MDFCVIHEKKAHVTVAISRKYLAKFSRIWYNDREALNESSFCGKRLEYMGFFRKNNLKSEVP